MKMTRRLAITIAVVCGALAALLTYIYLSGLQKQQPEPVSLQVSVVTPVKSIEAGTMITAEMLHAEKIPEDQVPSGAVRHITQIERDVAAEELPAGQPITLMQMASQRGGVDLSYVVPPGMRAVTVALDPIIGVAGFLKPGDRVDVIASFELEDTVLTRTVLQNVELLALGETTIVSRRRTADAEEGGEEEAQVKTQPNATVAVTLPDAQKLIASDAWATLRLALRRKGETEYKALRPTDLASLVGVELRRKEVEEERPPTTEQPVLGPPGGPILGQAPGPPRPSVVVIRGTEREIVTF